MATTRILVGKVRVIKATQSPEQIKLQSNINRQASAARIDRDVACLKASLAKLDGLDHKLAMVTEAGWSSWYNAMVAIVERAEQGVIDDAMERAVRLEHQMEVGRL
jgi:hypothetical protein